MQLGLAPPRPVPDNLIVLGLRGHRSCSRRARAGPSKKGRKGRAEEEGQRQRWQRQWRGRAQVLALRHGQDPAVADRAHGTEDSVQRLWREVQVGQAGARVQARGEPDFCSD